VRPLSPANVDYAPVECYKHDPARAQALFKRPRRPKTLALTLDTPSGRYPLDKDVSLAMPRSCSASASRPPSS